MHQRDMLRLGKHDLTAETRLSGMSVTELAGCPLPGLDEYFLISFKSGWQGVPMHLSMDPSEGMFPGAGGGSAGDLDIVRHLSLGSCQCTVDESRLQLSLQLMEEIWPWKEPVVGDQQRI